MKCVWGAIAISFGSNTRPNSLGQFWDWIKVILPGGEAIFTLGLAAICWAP